MPLFKAEIRRSVTRTVTLEQSAVLWIEADSLEIAKQVVINAQHSDDVEEYVAEWRDENDTRQAGSDRHVEMIRRSPYPLRVGSRPASVTLIDAKQFLGLED